MLGPKRALRRISLINRASATIAGRALDRSFERNRRKYSAGSLDSSAHVDRLRRIWSARRVFSEPSAARIALVCMETWEKRSLIPPILRDFQAVHIPIVDTADPAIFSAQQTDVIERVKSADAAAPLDVVLMYASAAQVSPSTFHAISALGPLVAVMCLDDKHSFEDKRPQRAWEGGQRPLIGAAHVHLTNSRECIRWYDCHDASALHWPEGANPDFGLYPDQRQDIDVSFVGQRYGARGPFIDRLRDAGISVTCFGDGWENPPLPELEMFRLYARSRINLGIGYVGCSSTITCLKGRDFDVPGSGQFYLTTFDAELAEAFVPGREIACYRNARECIELIGFYLERPDLRAEMKNAARARVLREHTWPHRINSLLRAAGALKE